jgi:hypothetical protein
MTIKIPIPMPPLLPGAKEINVPLPFMILVDDEDKEARYEICKSCNRFELSTEVCVECNCSMPTKILFADSECPLGKWSKVKDD